MVGRKVQLTVDRGESHPAVRSLVIKDMHVKDDRGHEAVRGVSLEMRSGEILGIAGVAGNGQDELVEALDWATAGIELDGRPRRPRHHKRLAAADQPGGGRVRACRSSPLRAGAVLPDRRQPRADQLLPRPRTRAARCANDDAIATRCRGGDPETSTSGRHRPQRRAGTLSGGNQQKVVVAREFDRDLKLLVLDQPTRGLDVGSIEFIHRLIIEKRNAGTAVLLVSAELDEVLEMSDRIAVMYRGKIVAEMRRADGRQERGRVC